MSVRTGLITLLFCLMLSVPTGAQLRTRMTQTSSPPPISDGIRATAAYAEIILRKTELESTVEELLISYKEEFPKVKNSRYELSLLEAELLKFSRLKESETGKLTLALGKLIVRRAELATDYWVLSNKYNDAHPEVKKVKRKLEIFDRAVKDIL